MRRCVIIGLDGFDFALAERWMQGGALPCLAALRDSGAFLACDSTIPPATFPAWTTCVTGVNPGKHGVFDFTHIPPGTQSLSFANSASRRMPALWNLLTDQGRRCCVLGVPATYPPEPIAGVMVSGFDSPVTSRIDTSFVYPASMFAKVRGWRYGAIKEERVSPRMLRKALPLLLAKIRDKADIALDLLAMEAWDFFMAVFNESDTAGHHFWTQHDPLSPRSGGEAPSCREDPLLRVYQALDAVVGRFMEATGAFNPSPLLMVVSDHGMGGAGTAVLHINNWLASRGLLTFKGGGCASLVKSAALAVIPQSWRGTLVRWLPGLAARTEARARFEGIDWGRTLAWSEELNYFPSVRLNLVGRDPFGMVQADYYMETRERICRELEACPLIRRVLPRDAVHHGPWVELAPDILIETELEEGYSATCLRSRGGAPIRRLRAGESLGGRGRGTNGTHRPEGVFYCSESVTAGRVHLRDIAPTALAWLGFAAPHMDGTPLLPVPDGAPAISSPDGLPRNTDAGYDARAADLVEERLRALGYIE